MIYQELTKHTFAYELSKDKSNGFSYEGAELLFNYLEGFGEDIEFDPVALRCEYSEYTKEELIENYSYSAEVEGEDLDENDEWEIVKDYIENNTVLLEDESEDVYIILDF